METGPTATQTIPNTSDYEQQLKSANETIYKHSLELVTKNKTLALLGKLYEIATLALEDVEMAERMTAVIQAEFNFEIVGMLLYDQTKDALNPLAFALSVPVAAAAARSTFKDDFAGSVSRFVHIKKALTDKQMVYVENCTQLFCSESQQKILGPLAEAGVVRASLVYPLTVNDKVLGILVLSLNRGYHDVVGYEREAMRSFVGVIAIALDKVLLYEQLQHANAQLKVLDQQKSEFLSIASHQLRTPLTAIKWSAGAILEAAYGDVPKNLHDPIQTIFDESTLMGVFINDYLNISRIEQGRMEYHFTEMNVTETLRAVASEMRPAVTTKGLKLVADIPDEKLVLWGDGGKLTQVFSNLIDNAIKYTPTGTITLSVRKVASEAKIRVEIRDTGIGIPKETLPTLFDKFTRGKNASDVNSAGSGLGLFVARTFVLAHKGRVWPESEGEGKGAVFIIELPLLAQ